MHQGSLISLQHYKSKHRLQYHKDIQSQSCAELLIIQYSTSLRQIKLTTQQQDWIPKEQRDTNRYISVYRSVNQQRKNCILYQSINRGVENIICNWIKVMLQSRIITVSLLREKVNSTPKTTVQTKFNMLYGKEYNYFQVIYKP